MIQMKWRADSENSENSALDTIIVTHKIYEKKYFLIGLTLLRRIEQLNTLLVYQVYLVYNVFMCGYVCVLVECRLPNFIKF